MAIRQPHLGVRVPRAELTGVRVCAFGTVSVIQKTAAGYQARWLVHGIPALETPMPPQRFGDRYYSHLKSLDPPPAEPKFLVWLHDVAAAVLPDGRISVWSSQGKAWTVPEKPTPMRTWYAGPNTVVGTIIDTGGNIQIRRSPEFGLDLRIEIGNRALVRAVTSDAGTWTLAADADGGAVMWTIQDGPARVLFEGKRGTVAEPVLPLAVIGNVFVVGRGRAVELWTPDRLEEAMGKK